MPAPLKDEGGVPREVYALLAQANLLRMRGRWDESVDNCMAALRLAPDSPSAQSLLGDIYENQGRFDDAVQWYRMALDANPDSPADRLKLDRLLQRQMPALRAERQVAPDAGVPAPTAAPLFWRRLTRDPEAALRWGALAAAMLVCLIVVFAYATVHRRAALAALGLGPFQEVKTAPIVVPPASGPLPADGADGASRDAAEQAVLDSLRGAGGLGAQGVTVTDVQFDPRAARMTVTVSLPAGSGLTRAAVLRAALHAAEAGAVASPSATAFTVRGLMASGGGEAGTTRVFVGDVSQSALPAAGAADPDDDHVQALFTDPWWSPQMPG